MRKIEIASEIIDDTTDCFTLAEIGYNHQGNVKTYLEMFKVAKDCRANAVKLQKRDNKRL
jgi:sialic acid synthase